MSSGAAGRSAPRRAVLSGKPRIVGVERLDQAVYAALADFICKGAAIGLHQPYIKYADVLNFPAGRSVGKTVIQLDRFGAAFLDYFRVHFDLATAWIAA
jgi:hypothetical protein